MPYLLKFISHIDHASALELSNQIEATIRHVQLPFLESNESMNDEGSRTICPGDTIQITGDSIQSMVEFVSNTHDNWICIDLYHHHSARSMYCYTIRDRKRVYCLDAWLELNANKYIAWVLCNDCALETVRYLKQLQKKWNFILFLHHPITAAQIETSMVEQHNVNF